MPRPHEDPLELWRSAATRPYAGTVFTNPRSERTCENCVHRGECYLESHESNYGNLNGSAPPIFERREGWGEERFVRHMKNIYAQMCGTFENRHQEIRERQEARDHASTERTEKHKAEKEGWDY